MISYVYSFIKYLPLIFELITAVVAIVVLVKFNTHTKKTEEVEMQHLYIDQLRNITNDAHELLDQIQDFKILSIVSLLKEGKNNEITFDDIRRLGILMIKCHNSVTLITEPTFEASDYFGNEDNVTNKIDPKQSLSEQRVLLLDFINFSLELISEYESKLSGDGNEVEKTQIFIKTLKIYLSDEDGDNKVDNETDIDTTIMILMVAMRKSLDDSSWSIQSLGDWRISAEKASKLTYILGINVESRNIVSLTKVGNPEFIINNDKSYCRFEIDNSEQVYQQTKGKQELPIKLNEATHWNPRNPVRYVYLNKEELDNIKIQLKET